jgi:putative tricarboxylic transport membrane protein
MDSVKMTRRTLDMVSAVFWFALALFVCYRATLLGLGGASEPGSGFIFFWSGLIMACLSLAVLVDSLQGVIEERPALAGTNWPKLFLVLLGLVLYGLLLERVGFVVTTFVLLIFLLRIGEETRWPTVLTVASVAAFSSFALFDLWLKIRLPKGTFGF